ncbi:hypothetical protein AXF42_Ash017449 [Apostasia shenzhenica]|uniref:CRAL-TRIO domain-containing protein n=1 Tax=Apostasia shenzhenica TaxID=1088818 RepID=A0A2H9ZZ17_9ASPA|nr:hypothetical protein AXF42_Ash017449 [Apostasia shenzhenica]
MSTLSKRCQTPRSPAGEEMRNRSLASSPEEAIPLRPSKLLVSSKTLRLIPNHSAEIFSLAIKVAALETLRRFSKARCPILWRVVRSFQVLSYPPFKWMQRWGPLRILVNGAQKISRPLLLLSIATTFSDLSDISRGTTDNVDDLQPVSDSLSRSSSSDSMNSHETSKDVVQDNWLLELSAEMVKLGISLPERLNEAELRRFYTAANGDLSSLVSSLKKTIHWRESYNILSSQELEVWSHVVFWHGFDVMLRPCLVIRLGLACSTLAPQDRSHFVQVVVSQIEHGLLSFIDDEVQQITVLIDCERLSPFKFPMNMLKSCSTLVQDHYPNRLGALLILRLPSLVRVLAQTFIQVLKPTTRDKLQFVGENNPKFLSDFLGLVPAFLGGDCRCSRCRLLSSSRIPGLTGEISVVEPTVNELNVVSASNDYPAAEFSLTDSCDHILRAAIIAVLMLWVLIAVFAAMNDPNALPSFF